MRIGCSGWLTAAKSSSFFVMKRLTLWLSAPCIGGSHLVDQRLSPRLRCRRRRSVLQRPVRDRCPTSPRSSPHHHGSDLDRRLHCMPGRLAWTSESNTSVMRIRFAGWTMPDGSVCCLDVGLRAACRMVGALLGSTSRFCAPPMVGRSRPDRFSCSVRVVWPAGPSKAAGSSSS